MASQIFEAGPGHDSHKDAALRACPPLAHRLQLVERMTTARVTQLLGAASLAIVTSLIGCGGNSKGGAGGAGTPGAGGTGQSSVPLDPGSKVSVAASASEALERQQLAVALTDLAGLTPETLAARYPTAFASTLGYDPLAAQNLSLIQASALKLNDAETQILKANGFVVTDRYRYPSFAYGYQAIYGQDLPVFVSADSILFALHRSYDDILKAIETTVLIPECKALLTRMRLNLQAGKLAALGSVAQQDADFYLAVALSLLDDTVVAAPVAGASAKDVANFVAKAKAAAGAEPLKLFDSTRQLDFSQFTPRGHYTDSDELKRYFRAMTWLGRIDFRILETQSDGTQLFRRRQFDAGYSLVALMDATARTSFARIDGTIESFVGESDNMTAPQFEALLTAMGAASVADVKALPDATILDALVAGDYGRQRISSHYMVNGLGKGTLPLSRTFLLLGQRYVIDSHVFSNVVYDRAAGGGAKRMMPDPLDAAFAALGNNQAAALLKPALEAFPYAPDLAAMRVLADAHGDSFWGANLYNRWLGALRALSPAADATAKLPAVATTEAWGRRMLNTQLASWAELRHDTILYAKQSYTAGIACEFPDAFIDPYPAFYAAVGAFAAKGQAALQPLTGLGGDVVVRAQAYFARLQEITALLQEMAEYQRDAKPFTAAHMQFINQAVVIQNVCGGGYIEKGWYKDLFFGDALSFDPTIADVHTQPTDVGGNEVGRILHVATGYARLMVTTVNTCAGPRAYAGLVSSYFENTTDKWKRLTDEEWKMELVKSAQPAEVPWMSGLVAH